MAKDFCDDCGGIIDNSAIRAGDQTFHYSCAHHNGHVRPGEVPGVRGFEKVEFEVFRDAVRDSFELDSGAHHSPIDDIARDMYERVRMPERATAESAGYDFFAYMKLCIHPGDVVTIPTGIKAYMKKNEFLKIYPRSGHGFGFLRMANNVGIIDADYQQQIWVKLRNESRDETVVIQPYEGMAQGIFGRYLLVDGDEFNGPERKGGFGSTG